MLTVQSWTLVLIFITTLGSGEMATSTETYNRLASLDLCNQVHDSIAGEYAITGGQVQVFGKCSEVVTKESATTGGGTTVFDHLKQHSHTHQ